MHEMLDIDAPTGLLLDVRQVLSPHFDQRPAQALPSLIVVHGISLPPGEFGGPWIDRLFTGNLPAAAHPEFAAIATLRVSAHAVIRRRGEITQYVPFGARAWHAGESSYQGRSACNDFSVGIELEGSDQIAYAEPQYRSLGRIDPGAVHRISEPERAARGGPQRYRARPQDRPRAGVRLAAATIAAGLSRPDRSPCPVCAATAAHCRLAHVRAPGPVRTTGPTGG